MGNRTGRRGVAIGAPGRSGRDGDRAHAPAASRGGDGSALPPAVSDPPAGAGALPLRLPAALAVLASLLLIAATPWLGMVQSVLVLPWFVPTVTALVCLASERSPFSATCATPLPICSIRSPSPSPAGRRCCSTLASCCRGRA